MHAELFLGGRGGGGPRCKYMGMALMWIRYALNFGIPDQIMMMTALWCSHLWVQHACSAGKPSTETHYYSQTALCIINTKYAVAS